MSGPGGTINLTNNDDVFPSLTDDNSGSETINGLDGNDIIDGGAGNDTLNGGNGNDTLYGGTGSDGLSGGAGDDSLHGGDGDDGLNDTIGAVADLHGDAGNDTILFTSNLKDTLNGGLGADVMDGGDGDDKYYVDNAGDTVTDSSGLDLIYTTTDYALGAGIERLYANTDNGLILTGNGADNTIVGRGGDDTIIGGGGRDVMKGGAGSDTFVLNALSDSLATSARDVIQDFQVGVDKIDLSAIDAVDGGGQDTFSFIGSANFTAAGQLRWVATANGDTLVQANTGGTIAADFSILLQGAHTLGVGDFILT